MVSQSLNEKSLGKLKEEIQNADIISKLEFEDNIDPNVNYDKFDQILQAAITKHLPKQTKRLKKYKDKKTPWITNGILKSIRFRDKLYSILKTTSRNCSEYNARKTNLQTYNRILKQNIRCAKRSYYQQCFQKYKSDIKNTWKTIGSLLNKTDSKKDIPSYFVIHDHKLDDQRQIANEFNNYFVQIGSQLANKIVNQQNKSFTQYLKQSQSNIFQFQNIDQQKILKIIDGLSPKSSSGFDGISTILLKGIKNEICHPLTLIVNQTLKTGIFPDKLKVSKVIPVYKKGENTDIANYRPISLLPSVSKIFERIIHEQITDHFNRYSLLFHSQYGFRSNHSTEYAALELVDKIIAQMDNRKTPISIFLDLTKAFDTIDHNILLHKLEYYGIKGQALDLLKSYLTNRKQYVTYGSVSSDLMEITHGVPQGSILGPLLFIIYVNDLSHATNIFNTILYADDTTLVACLENFNKNKDAPISEIENQLNTELQKVNEWLNLNKLSINTSKTKGMIFTSANQNDPPQLQLRMNNNNINWIDEFNFLGITIDAKLNWKSHINKISNKISKILGILYRIKNIVHPKILHLLYNSLISPHLSYGILTWGYKNTQSILKLQKKAVRIIAKAKFNAHSDPLFKDLCLLKIEDILKLQELKLYYKLKHNLLPRYLSTEIFTPLTDIHPYNTRRSHLMYTSRVQHEYAKRCMRYSIPTSVLEAPSCILNKIETHSIEGYVNYIKYFFLEQYQVTCQIINCYICR